MKTREHRAFGCLETLMKHNVEIASQSCIGNKIKWKSSRRFHMLSASFLLRKICCLGDLPFQKGCHQFHHNAVKRPNR